jgi:L-threonylcarbamoyladenylate synthase
LLKLAGLPLAAPSANPFGYVSPTTAAHVRDGLGGKIRHILEGGAARIGVESTIVDLRHPGRPQLLRPGAITLAELERALGQQVLPPPGAAPATPKKGQLAPGLLARHYSPRTPVELHERLVASDDATQAFVFIQKPRGRRRGNIFWLDPRGNLRGAARALFATLRKLDALRFKRIHVELAPGDGLAQAINDRLRRAAAR